MIQEFVWTFVTVAAVLLMGFAIFGCESAPPSCLATEAEAVAYCNGKFSGPHTKDRVLEWLACVDEHTERPCE
jgi:hypothetical protein